MLLVQVLLLFDLLLLPLKKHTLVVYHLLCELHELIELVFFIDFCGILILGFELILLVPLFVLHSSPNPLKKIVFLLVHL